VAAKLLRNF